MDELGDELDLHTFRPQDVPELIPDYIDECLRIGYRQVRIIHGKGKGTLRRIVHGALERHAGVASFELAEGNAGGWGATLVKLNAPKPQRHSPAAERNAAGILEVLQRVLPNSGTVLEIASGGGQHAIYFAEALANLQWQPTDLDRESMSSIAIRLKESSANNILPPLVLDVCTQPWPLESASAMLCVNMIHISPWSCCEALMAGASTVLSSGAPLVLYGPYLVDGEPTAASNTAFDESLRARNPEWGIRNLEVVKQCAAAAGLDLVERIDMAANNMCLVFRRVH